MVCLIHLSSAVMAELSSTGSLDSLDVGIKQFDVEVSDSMRELAVSTGPTAYDFSNHELLTMKTGVNCLYRIAKFGKDYAYVANVGILNVDKGGRVSFKENQWGTGGMSDPKYLRNEANLRVDIQGRLLGKIPIFHQNIKKGQGAEPPVYDTEFDGKYFTLGALDLSRLDWNQEGHLWWNLGLGHTRETILKPFRVNNKEVIFAGEHVAKRRGADFHLQIRYCAEESVIYTKSQSATKVDAKTAQKLCSRASVYRRRGKLDNKWVIMAEKNGLTKEACAAVAKPRPNG